MKSRTTFLAALLLAVVAAPATLLATYFTSGLTAASFPLTGSETFPSDTNLSSGRTPQQESISVNQIKGYARAVVTLTDGANISLDASLGEVYTVTLGGNRTLDTPSNAQSGKVIRVKVVQDGTGSRTLAYQGIFKWPAGTAPTLTTTGSRWDMLTFVYDGTNWIGRSDLNYF